MNAEKQIEKEARANLWTHAYLFIGGDEEKIERTVDFITDSKKILKEDILEIQSSGEEKSKEIKVSDIKKFINQLSLSPLGSERLAIIRDCEKLNQSSANILLKSIEEPVGKITFLLISGTNKILPTIRSRCRVYTVPTFPKFCQIDLNPEAFLELEFYKAGQAIDALIKKDQVAEFLNNSLYSFREELLRQKKKELVELIEFTEKIRNDIKNNTNVKLALECLWFKAREIKSGRN